MILVQKAVSAVLLKPFIANVIIEKLTVAMLMMKATMNLAHGIVMVVQLIFEKQKNKKH